MTRWTITHTARTALPGSYLVAVSNGTTTRIVEACEVEILDHRLLVERLEREGVTQ